MNITKKIKHPFTTAGFLFFFYLLSITSHAQGNKGTKLNSQKDTTALKAGYAGSEPFIIKEDHEWTGISIELWKAIASKKDWNYTPKGYPSVSEAIAALNAGEIDMVVGPSSITAERAEKVQFTQPYFQSSLSILSRVDDPTIWDRISPFFSIKLLYGVLVFLFILACVGTLLWLAERKEQSHQFSEQPARGIGTGMWCAIVTMSTTGYGDIAPTTLTGRIVAGAWMVISIIFATTMVAGIASTLTLTGMGTSTISTAKELKNKNIAVLEDSPGIEFVNEHGGKQVEIGSLEEGYKLLKDKKVDGIVFDRPQLLYFLKKHPDGNMVVSISQYLKQGYGFAFPLNSDRVHDMNVELLHLKENGELFEISSTWLGKDGKQ